MMTGGAGHHQATNVSGGGKSLHHHLHHQGENMMPTMAAIPKPGNKQAKKSHHSNESRKSIGSNSQLDFTSLRNFVQSLSLLSPAARAATPSINAAVISPMQTDYIVQSTKAAAAVAAVNAGERNASRTPVLTTGK